jgi:hypothetical protein
MNARESGGGKRIRVWRAKRSKSYIYPRHWKCSLEYRKYLPPSVEKCTHRIFPGDYWKFLSCRPEIFAKYWKCLTDTQNRLELDSLMILVAKIG